MSVEKCKLAEAQFFIFGRGGVTARSQNSLLLALKEY
jgi:hypothetical protein